MDLKELRDLLLKRLHIELQLFKDSIEVFVNSYEILLEDMERLDGDTVRGLLYQNFGILDFLYQEWLTREDCVFDELKAYISGELGVIAKINSPVCGKEGADGTEFNKAA